ncbi:MAG: 6,7-dimethyl-8-ribityllumazine synthase [Elusimicrobiota bacterium]
MKNIEGKLSGRGKRFAIVVSRFNSLLSNRLLDGAIDCLKRHEVEENKVDIFWVPGAFEIPVTVKKLTSKNYDAIIALGAIIKGDTPHFDYIASETAKGIAMVSVDKEIPVAFGIITADNIEQAIERAGTKQGNKGFDAAMTALEMANLFDQIK